MKKIFSKIGVVGIIIAFMLVSGCINDDEEIKNNGSANNQSLDYNTADTETDTINSSVVIDTMTMTSSVKTEGNLVPNYPLYFETGEKFIYDMRILEGGIMYNVTQQYTIDGIDNINGNKSYNVDYIYEYPTTEAKIETSILNGEEHTNKYERTVVTTENRTAYINIKDGNIVDILVDNGESIMSPEINYKEGIWMFAPWMLSIEKGKKWRVFIDKIINNKVVETFVVSYEVSQDVEKINNRNCFKININWGTKDDKKELIMADARMIMFVDTEKRITVKMESYYNGNLHGGGMDLVSGL